MSDLMAVILAAGKGTRMKSALPKVLHQVGGRPMVQHVLHAANEAGVGKNVVVIGFGADSVREYLGNQVEYAVQEQQLGTGHAMLQAKTAIGDFSGTILVLCGDTPLLRGETLKALCQAHRHNQAAATVLTVRMPDPTGYGRVIRDGQGQVLRIVEQKDAGPDELSCDEINTGIYCFQTEALFSALSQITCENQQGEYYLTDVLEILGSGGNRVGAVLAEDYQEMLGINSRAQLAEAEKILRQRKLAEAMNNGVTIMDPASTFIDAGVVIGADTVIYPFTWLEGSTMVGRDCQIGPNTRLQNAVIGDSVTIHFSYGHDCRVADHVTVGPYVHLRPGADLGPNVKVGNFVEVKNSHVGANSKLPHLSYIGDADIGERVNIGCGTITVNYDGVKKYRTTIEDDAFVGCNSNLVAPVTVGEGAYVGAGSTITKEVPAQTLAVARARQTNITGWIDKRKK
ncbi:MAG: glmU [Firmicutes bacterium]|nr:glmU [Bacillota bacterium]